MTSSRFPATVIGARGYVGRALVSLLQRQGRTVLAPSRGHESALVDASDIGDLFYCAGLTADFAVHPPATAEAHLGLLARLLDRFTPRRVVYLSSTRLFDSRPGEVVTGTTPLILDPLNPRHLYDLTKAAGEALVLAVAGERARIARLSSVWSLESDAPGFLPNLVRRLQASHHNLNIVSHPLTARHYLHLGDAVRALIALADADHHPSITCLAAEPTACTNRSLVEFLERRLNRSVTFSFSQDSEPADPPILDLTAMNSLSMSFPDPLFEHLDQVLHSSSHSS